MKRPVKVLVADDRRATRQGLRALLSLLPEVEIIAEAVDGRQSLDFVAECRPDVVLMDLQMPGMDGIEATRRIKEQWPAVRVIALTIHPQYRAQALAAGADIFLLKESDPQALVSAILNKVDVSI
ncbi:MAG: response regulator transcription factor [Anaerolineae bacterium]|jgi:DNA-binding NarL/FixJ family response regulator